MLIRHYSPLILSVDQNPWIEKNQGNIHSFCSNWDFFESQVLHRGAFRCRLERLAARCSKIHRWNHWKIGSPTWHQIWANYSGDMERYGMGDSWESTRWYVASSKGKQSQRVVILIEYSMIDMLQCDKLDNTQSENYLQSYPQNHIVSCHGIPEIS